MFGVMRTGVRLVMTNPADPRRVEDYAAWYDPYGAALTGPGFLANAFRFENSAAAGTEDDPRFVAVYDIVTSDPATAWPQTVGSPQYPTSMFDDPRSKLVAPAFRASYALVGSQDSGPLSGVHIALTDGADDSGRQQWAARAGHRAVLRGQRVPADRGLPRPDGMAGDLGDRPVRSARSVRTRAEGCGSRAARRRSSLPPGRRLPPGKRVPAGALTGAPTLDGRNPQVAPCPAR